MITKVCGMWVSMCVNNPLLASLYFWSQLVPLQGIRILYRAQKIVHRFKCEEILYKHRIVTCRLIKSFFEKKKNDNLIKSINAGYSRYHFYI